MNIWVIGRSYPTKQNKMRGSFELEQAKLLADHGHQVSYIAAIFHPVNKVKKWGYCSFKDENVDIYTESIFFAPERMHFHLKFMQGKVWERLLDRVEKEQGIPDIIHVHYPGMVSIPEPVLTYQKRGAKIVTTDHWSKTLLNTMDSFQRKQLIKYADQADAVLCVGQPLKDSIIKITGTTKEVHVVPNVVSSLFCYKQKESESVNYNFIAVGRLVPIKQMDMITLAFARNFAGKESIHLTIVGSGDEKEKINKIVNDYNVCSQVHLLGTLSREETAKQISDSDALICYSRFETFGVPVIEAWACGKPVIGSDSLGVLEYWNDELGYIVQHDDIEALQQAMQQIYERKESYNHSKIAEFAKNHFGEKAVYEELMEVYSIFAK